MDLISAGSFSSLVATFKWKLDSQVFKSAKIDTITSPQFNANNARWQLELYPKAAVPHEEYFSIFLRFLSPSGNGFPAKFRLSIMNNDNKAIRSCKTGTYTFVTNQSFGFLNFYKREALLKESNNILTMDKGLILRCDIVVHTGNNHTEVLTRLDSLFNNEKFSDVKFEVKKQYLHAHKNILSIKSNVFAAMFEHDMKENRENVVKITDISYEVVLEMLRFIYTGRVNNMMALAQPLLMAAEKYEINDLKAVCAECLCKKLTVANSLEYLAFANRYRVDLLEENAIEYIVTHAPMMVDMSGFDAILKMPEEVTMKFIRKMASKLPFVKPQETAECIVIDDD